MSKFKILFALSILIPLTSSLLAAAVPTDLAQLRNACIESLQTPKPGYCECFVENIRLENFEDHDITRTVRFLEGTPYDQAFQENSALLDFISMVGQGCFADPDYRQDDQAPQQ